MTTRGRPPSAAGALTPAQRKSAQRARDHAALWAVGAAMDELTTSALLESLASLIAEQRAGTLGAVLVELGRRGGVTVTARPAAMVAGGRVKK